MGRAAPGWKSSPVRRASPWERCTNYFEDRQELIEALLELRRRELLERLDAALENSRELAFERQLEAFLGAALLHFQLHRASSRCSCTTRCRPSGARVGRRCWRCARVPSAAYPHVLVGLLEGLLETVLETDGVEVTAKLLAPAVRCFLQGARS
jgi:AcrR family transcriptional regulator